MPLPIANELIRCNTPNLLGGSDISRGRLVSRTAMTRADAELRGSRRQGVARGPLPPGGLPHAGCAGICGPARRSGLCCPGTWSGPAARGGWAAGPGVRRHRQFGDGERAGRCRQAGGGSRELAGLCVGSGVPAATGQGPSSGLVRDKVAGWRGGAWLPWTLSRDAGSGGRMAGFPRPGLGSPSAGFLWQRPSGGEHGSARLSCLSGAGRPGQGKQGLGAQVRRYVRPAGSRENDPRAPSGRQP